MNEMMKSASEVLVCGVNTTTACMTQDGSVLAIELYNDGSLYVRTLNGSAVFTTVETLQVMLDILKEKREEVEKDELWSSRFRK